MHQEMVSVTGSVTWISHSSSVIGKNPDPRRQRDEKHANRYRRKEPREAERGLAQRRKKMPLPFQGAGQGTDPPIHRQVRKVDREPGAQEPIWWERTPGCRVSCRISALRIILGSKEKDSSARPAASVNVYTISATSSAL